MKKKKLLYLIFLYSVFVVSCSKEPSLGIEYIPFQESENGMWGMISPDGEVLFSEEFKNEPTCAKDGLFMVKNDNKLWEIYTAESKPKQVGDEYLFASSFENGRAFVVKLNGYVSIIDREGKEIKILDKIGNNTIDYVDSFNEGYAVYSSGGYDGAIDYDGKEILKSDYVYLTPCNDGKFIGVNKKYEKEYTNKSEGNYSFDVIDTNGKTLFSLSNEKYLEIGDRFVDGLLPVAVEIDGEKCWGLINDKNEAVLKPSAKIKEIVDIKGDKFIYSNGEGVGMMNINGDVLIRAKYDYLSFEKSNRLFAVTENKCRLIDEEDNRIGDEEYLRFYSSRNYEGEVYFVKVSDKMWSIIDFEGKHLKKLPDMINLGTNTGDLRIKNDHIDFSALLSNLKLSVNSVDDITLQKTSAKEIAKILEKYYPDEGNDDHPISDPYWHDERQGATFKKSITEIEVRICAFFPSSMSRRVYKTEYDYYGYSYEVLAGYEFNNITVHALSIEFANKGKLTGKLRLLFNALNDYIKQLGGKLEKSNNNASVYTYNKNNRVHLYNDGEKVNMIWGNLKPVEELDIDQYKNIYDDDKNQPVADSTVIDSI